MTTNSRWKKIFRLLVYKLECIFSNCILEFIHC